MKKGRQDRIAETLTERERNEFYNFSLKTTDYQHKF